MYHLEDSEWVFRNWDVTRNATMYATGVPLSCSLPPSPICWLNGGFQPSTAQGHDEIKLTSHEKTNDAHGKCHQHDDGQLKEEGEKGWARGSDGSCWRPKNLLTVRNFQSFCTRRGVGPSVSSTAKLPRNRSMESWRITGESNFNKHLWQHIMANIYDITRLL